MIWVVISKEGGLSTSTPAMLNRVRHERSVALFTKHLNYRPQAGIQLITLISPINARVDKWRSTFYRL